jgi:hypothetical protein
MISGVNLTQYGYGMRDCDHRRRKCATREGQRVSHIRLPPDSLRALAVGRNINPDSPTSATDVPRKNTIHI